MPRHLQRIWDGSPLDARRVLVRCYHGLGDTIQFARYLPLLCGRASDVIVWAQPKLLALLRTLDADVTWLPLHDGAPDADYDVDIELMELPGALGIPHDALAWAVPYLKATAAPPPGPSPRVGIAWRAGNWDDRRSIPFACLSPLLRERGVHWCSLQFDRHEEESHPNLTCLGRATVAATAGHMRSLDLVVSVDSMPAHLAGALAVPVWTLLRRHADWRWMEHRSDSPWYPTMRLFRQPREGAWESVVSDVLAALRCAGRS